MQYTSIICEQSVTERIRSNEFHIFLQLPTAFHRPFIFTKDTKLELFKIVSSSLFRFLVIAMILSCYLETNNVAGKLNIGRYIFSVSTVFLVVFGLGCQETVSKTQKWNPVITSRVL